MKLIQYSSLSPKEKAKYAEILATATLTDPLYVLEDADVNGDGQSQSEASEGEEVKVNGTSNSKSSSASANPGGLTNAGELQTDSGNEGKSTSPQQSSDTSQGDAGGSSSESSSDSQAYEISKSSPAKSISGESNMPIVVIAAIILLIAIFLVGYVRGKDDFDDF